MIRLSEPCPQCGGTGQVQNQDRFSPYYSSEQCPACHSGMVPDDGTVEAAAKATIGADPDFPRWDLQPGRLREIALDIARRALVAAARYQSERGG